MKPGRDDRHEIEPCLLTFFPGAPGNPLEGTHVMQRQLATDLMFDSDTTSTAYKRAMKLLWLDILVTCAILAAVVSQL
jgi:hypothetical protein